MKRTSGQIAVLLLLCLPLLMVVLALVADVALVVVTKARLQVAADRAALAAGDALAQTLDQLADANWRIRSTWRAAKKDVEAHQQEGRREGMDRLRRHQVVIDRLRTDMDRAVADGYRQACEAAAAVATAETPWADFVPLYGDTHLLRDSTQPFCESGAPLFSFYQDRARPDQTRVITFTFPTDGSGWNDPRRIESASFPLLHYRTKAPGPDQQVAFALRLRSRLPVGVGRRLLFATADDRAVLDTAWLEAAAASQPFGGSIEAFAFQDADTLDEAETRAEAQEGLRYDATLVPLEQLQDRSLGYRGLRYFDEAQGWIEDEDEDEYEYGH